MDSPGINAGRGLKQERASIYRAGELDSPGINAGRGLKLRCPHEQPITCTDSPGINAGRGLKLDDGCLHATIRCGFARH